MKKFLALALVLGVVGLTNASIAGLQFSVDGLLAPDMIELVPSQTVVLDITASGGQLGSGFFLDLMGPGLITVSGAQQFVHFSGGVAKDAAEYVIDLGNAVGADQTIMLDLLIPGYPIPPLPNGKVVDLMVFHCTGPMDVTLTLWNTDTGAIMDTLLIKQIPEPITMVLLGLGGLFLRKR